MYDSDTINIRISVMKQTKQVKKEKDNYLKFTFLFPIITSIIDAVIVISALYVYKLETVSNVARARLLVETATILMAITPSFLLFNTFLSHRHSKKYPNGSAFYIKTPMLVTLLVWGVQMMYMVSLTGM